MTYKEAVAVQGLAAYVRKVIDDTKTGLHGKRWDIVYDLVFGQYDAFCDQHAWRLDWCDPDCGYDDDVMAFANALYEYVDDMPNVLPNPDGDTLEHRALALVDELQANLKDCPVCSVFMPCGDCMERARILGILGVKKQ